MATAMRNRLPKSLPLTAMREQGTSADQLFKMLAESLGYSVRKQHPERSFKGFLNAIMMTKSPDSRIWTKGREMLEKVYDSSYQTFSTAKSAMNEESGTAGGYLVPMDYTARLLETISENSFIYPRANVIPLGSAEMQCPMIDAVTAQSAGTPPWFGGINFKWGSEQAPAETEPTFRSLSLKAWDLLGYAVVSNQFLMDITPVGGEEYLIKLLGKAAAYAAEYAFLQGTGTATKMPLGVLKAPATKLITRQVSGTIIANDIATMAATMIPYGWTGGIWACHPSALAYIARISNYFINGDWSFDGACGYLMTKPLFVTDKLPATSSTSIGDLIFFDPTLYVIGDRMEVLIDVSSEGPGFANYQTNFRTWLRIDGKPLLSNTVTMTDGTVGSAYIALSS